MKQADEEYCPEASESGENGSQQRQYGRSEEAQQQRQFAADQLHQKSAGDIARDVAIVVRRENSDLSLQVPVEDSARLQTWQHKLPDYMLQS